MQYNLFAKIQYKILVPLSLMGQSFVKKIVIRLSLQKLVQVLQ